MHPLFTILSAKRGCIISSFYFYHIIVTVQCSPPKCYAFYTCFLKFCLALNSYILSFILKKLPRKRSDSLFNIDDTNINNAIYGKVHD